MEEVSYMTRLRSYLGEYSRSVESIGDSGFKLGKNVRDANDILSRTKEKGRSPRQHKFLEDMCGKLELYVETGREFAGEHRQELIEMYKEAAGLYEGYKGKRNSSFGAAKGRHTMVLQRLEGGRVIFPGYFNVIRISMHALNQRDVETGDLGQRITRLADAYWAIFNRRKTEGRSEAEGGDEPAEEGRSEEQAVA